MWQGYAGLMRLGFIHIQPVLHPHFGIIYREIHICVCTYTHSHTHMHSPPSSLGI